MKILTAIQTRTGSSRFPQKVLKTLGSKPLFVTMANRIKASRYAGQVVILTTFLPDDDIIEMISLSNGLECFRGHPTDLLDRHYQAGIFYGVDAVVKIPSDCPLVDISVIDKVIDFYVKNYPKYDYVSNLHPATYPDGNDVEIVSMKTLALAWRFADKDYEREHTTPFIWEQPERFMIGNIRNNGCNFSMTHRWCLDYPEDYIFIKTIYDELSPKNPFFGINEILDLLKRQPHIMEINKKYCGVNWYRHHINELKTITPSETRLEV
ncbi:MAG: glycosyltransferase family protein [Thermodesulfovibrionales bacterium]|nr:glycosyltransferase family protein [Thermodesulfovibrionales bacterium]